MMTPQANGMDELRRMAEVNRERIEAQNTEIAVLKSQHQTIARSLEEKHAQNRKDMHNWRNDMQTAMDKAWSETREARAEAQREMKRVGDEVKEIGKTMINLQLASARSKGFWLGAGAVFSVAVQLIGFWIEHLIK